LTKDAGVQRETLYRSFSEQGNPTFATLSSVLSALGMRLLVAADGKAGALGGDSAEVEVHRSRV
jgi:DNA-binding phage protein